MITPYRTESLIDKYVPKKYGLIKKNGENPWRAFLLFGSLFIEIVLEIKDLWNKHRCDYPKRLTRFWAGIKGVPFGAGSLYRCECGKAWEWDERRGKWYHDSYYSIGMWLKAGGEK